MLKSDKIYLKPLCDEDFELFKEIYSDPVLMKFIGPTLNNKSLIKTFSITIQNMNTLSPSCLFMVIKCCRTNLSIGITALQFGKNNIKTANIGVMIGRNFQQQGYAYQATNLILEYGFEKLSLKTIYARCESDNSRIIPVIVKNGFKKIETDYSYKRKKKNIIWSINKIQFLNARNLLSS